MHCKLVVALAAVALVSCSDSAAHVESDAPWSARLDNPLATEEIETRETPDGLEVQTGPNATLWRAGQDASGTYRLSARVTHLDSGMHPHGAGLAFGGRDVHGEGQAYTYFLVRSDGQYLIKVRNGTETADICPWTADGAVTPEDKDGVTDNRIAVEVTATEARFLINGKEVHRAPREKLHTEGLYGFRLVHDLHVRFADLRVEPLTP